MAKYYITSHSHSVGSPCIHFQVAKHTEDQTKTFQESPFLIYKYNKYFILSNSATLLVSSIMIVSLQKNPNVKTKYAVINVYSKLTD